jgi:hypothetical protein
LTVCRDDSGKKVDKCDHRFHCETCRLMGGRDDPCQPESYLRRYKELGRKCPKEDLLVEDTAAWEILKARVAGSPLLPVIAESETWWMHREQRRSALRAVQRAYGDPDVQKEVNPKR